MSRADRMAEARALLAAYRTQSDSAPAFLDSTPVPPPPLRYVQSPRRTRTQSIVRALRMAAIRLHIWHLEGWIRECDPDGCLSTVHLNGIRSRLEELRVRLALAEAS